jgi:hypothetical protein
MQVNELLSRVWLNVHFADLLGAAAEAPSGSEILDECLAVAKMLIEKNKLYGDSALNPARIFSKASPVEQILVRIDDKLNRLMKGEGKETEDIIGDLLGYIVLLRVAQRRKDAAGEKEVKPDEAYSPYLSGPVVILDPGAFPEAPEEPMRGAEFPSRGPGPFLTDEDVQEIRDVIRPREVSSGACQECGEPVEENVVVCDVCYQRRFGRAKIDLSQVGA